jgi:hypothetical protein
MLLIFSFIGLIIVGVILLKIVGKNWDFSVLGITAVFLIGAGAIALIASAPIAIIENTCYERYYFEWQTERDNLLARCSFDIRDDMLGHDIQKYNVKLRNAKYWNKNIWTSWLNESACQEFDEIRIEDIKGQ